MDKVEYLGSKIVDEHPYTKFTPQDWVLHFIFRYGQIDGGHHKAWVLDQTVRILNGTPVIVSKREWSNGKFEFDFETGEPSQKYLDWVKKYKGEAEEEYEYYEGIAP